MSRSMRAATACFAAALTIALTLPLLRPIDDAVAIAIQATRACDSDASAKRLGTVAVLLLAAGAAIVARRAPPAAALAGAVLTIASGALFGELLKTVFERLRPDGMPGSDGGNAFPSGHIMNTALAAAILWTLARPAGRTRSERGLLGVLLVAAVISQTASRMWLGAHWPSDAVVSVLLALGWVALAPLQFARAPGRSAVVSLVLLAVGLFFLFVPPLRPRLASPLDSPPPIVEIDVARESDRLAASGPWEHGHREPIGDIAWLRDLEGEIALPAPARTPGRLRLGVRPTTRGAERAFACVGLALSLNDWTAPTTWLVRGWRELRFAPPADAWRTEGNRIRLRVIADDEVHRERADYGFVALRFVRLTD